MRIVGKMRMDLSDKSNNARRGPGMTRLGHSVPKINPWAARPATLGGPLVALECLPLRHCWGISTSAGSTKPIYEYTA